jgi:hypothetical protein
VIGHELVSESSNDEFHLRRIEQIVMLHRANVRGIRCHDLKAPSKPLSVRLNFLGFSLNLSRFIHFRRPTGTGRAMTRRHPTQILQ